MKIVCAVAVLLASAGACVAEPFACDIPKSPPLGRIVQPGRVHFRSDGDGCPSDAPRCVLKSYVVHGDAVLLGQRTGAWQCASFPSAGWDGSTDGWLPVAAVQAFPNPPDRPPSAWAGHWVLSESLYIDIARKGTKLSIKGWWYGPRVLDEYLDAKASTPSGGNTLALDRRQLDDVKGCSATLQLVGPYLSVQASDACHGNVPMFEGVYRRR